MANYSEDYYLRKCFLNSKDVPTPSMMKKKMKPALAAVYFKSMTPKLRVIAGLEPPLKGGGTEWYVPPADLLKGRTVMKPLQKQYMDKLNCYGLDEIGMRLVLIHRERMERERDRLIAENDVEWQKKVTEVSKETMLECSHDAKKANTARIRNAVQQFSLVYEQAFTKLERILFDASVNQIKKLREETFQRMKTKYTNFVRQQGTMLYDRYAEKLMNEKERLKADFVETLENKHTELSQRLHDIKLEKHVAIEKIRHFLECQTLACQIYVGLVERQGCMKDMELSRHVHSKQMKVLTKEMAQKEFEMLLVEKRNRAQQEFVTFWSKKVCHVVKNFQVFISYCLNLIPEQAEFFINMEKLMLIQLNESLDNQNAETIITVDVEPVDLKANPHPLFLVCDQRYQTKVDATLCPKHCTSSASQLPAIVVNKRCIYAACDNFTQYADKIKSYIEGDRGIDDEFEDSENYSDCVPVKYSASKQISELKLQNSLLQVLQQEIANLGEVTIECNGCHYAHCFDCTRNNLISSRGTTSARIESTPVSSIRSGSSPMLSPTRALAHKREPKWKSYMTYVEPKKCHCGKMAKRHMMEHLPPYMRKMSPYEVPKLLNYEMCSVTDLKKLVKQAQGKNEIPPPPPTVTSKRDVSIQACDHEFDYLCTCFSDDDILQFYENVTAVNISPLLSSMNMCQVVGSSLSTSYLSQTSTAFVADRVMSLRRLVEQSPDVKEILCALPQPDNVEN